MATYVIGDIHGQLEQLKVLLEKMKFNENDELYVMGDVVDRGPDPIKALQYLMTRQIVYVSQEIMNGWHWKV